MELEDSMGSDSGGEKGVVRFREREREGGE